MRALIEAVLAADSRLFDSEDTCCDLLVGLRWPDRVIPCSECGKPTVRRRAYVVCEHGHGRTILMGTPLGSLRRPRVRAILLGMRAMVRSSRSVSARELARDVGMPHNTLWRHLMRLRVMMPRTLVAAARGEPPKETARAHVLVATVRTWLNGTFHGVSNVWLPRYLHEVAARWCCGAAAAADDLVDQLVRGGRVLYFERDVRPPNAGRVPRRRSRTPAAASGAR